MKKRKLTLRKEDIANLSNLNLEYVVGGGDTVTCPPRTVGGRVEACDTQADCATVEPCSITTVPTGGLPTDTKETIQLP